MAFGWFGNKASAGEKALQKADKLVAQGRWAEALAYYEDAGADAGSAAEAQRGVRACREHLVAWNLEEAAGFQRAGDLEKAREHGQLALDLAADTQDLAEPVQGFLAALGEPLPPPQAAPRERMFPPSCSCPTACGPGAAPAGEEPREDNPADLFEFYLESLGEAERAAFEPQGEAFQTGFVLLQQGETATARPHLELAAEQAPEAAAPVYALGLLAAVEESPAEADAWFARALAVDPDFAPAAHHRADVLREAGRFDDARAALEGWLASHGEDGEALALLAAVQLDAGDATGAARTAAQAGDLLDAADPRPALLRGRALRLAGDADGALQAYQALAARRPDLVPALVPLGQLLVERGGPAAERAAEVFKHCCRLEPERRWVHLLGVAHAYAVRGWPQEAREVLEAARRELPEDDAAAAQWQAVQQLLEGSAAPPG